MSHRHTGAPTQQGFCKCARTCDDKSLQRIVLNYYWRLSSTDLEEKLSSNDFEDKRLRFRLSSMVGEIDCIRQIGSLWKLNPSRTGLTSFSQESQWGLAKWNDIEMVFLWRCNGLHGPIDNLKHIESASVKSSPCILDTISWKGFPCK